MPASASRNAVVASVAGQSMVTVLAYGVFALLAPTTVAFPFGAVYSCC